MTTKKQAAAAAIVPAAETVVSTRTVEVIAAEIRYIDGQARQYVMQSAVEIGAKLTEAKELVPHGQWGNWLKEHVNYSQSTANNFMRLASEYSAAGPALQNLSYTQAVALLAVPAEERESFVEETQADQMSSRELQAAIKAREAAEQQLVEEQRRQADLKAEMEKLAAEKTEELKSLEERHKLGAELREAAEKQVQELQAELEKAQAAGDDKALAKSKAELRKAEKAKSDSEKKLATLQQQLEAAKAETEKTVADRVQQREQELQAEAKQRESAMQAEMDKLQQQLARSSNESFLRAKLQLENIIKSGDTLVKAIDEVKDEAEQAKLKTKAAEIIDKLRGML
ncbi:hypothetical protein PA598K_01363 [Paenibacillus sp. 598K]|uniref:DUF3102 domain-containing protein n=1 Tax=Paenibacillus sp. 598K TaxID=1117987 RepID=UPI000FF9EE3F|nr:DUF3102 domain-containing protein [Paenibacillus sp. 598K]GBF73078.1 hypothetical protein PA598K_01363 [Paenibacillus sp. 598K]